MSELPGIELVDGRGDLPMVRVRTSAAEADIYLHGAHVTHYKPADAGDVLFLSEQAIFDGKKAIRGGIPVCFPWFSDNGPADEAPAHGVVRTAQWTVTDLGMVGDDARVAMRYESNESTRRWWPHDFRCDYELTIGKRLDARLTVTNTGSDAFRYELALHTYLAVADVRQVTLEGFAGATYIDQLDANTTKQQDGEPTIEGEVDRIYQQHGRDVAVVDKQRKLLVAPTGSTSTVLWNPHVAKAARTADFGDDEWPQMLCVESAAIGDGAIDLDAGARHTLGVTLSQELL